VRDCWSGDQWETLGELSATVEPRGAAVYRVTPV